MRTVHGRALPVSSDQSLMPNIWRDYAPWRANENGCVAHGRTLQQARHSAPVHHQMSDLYHSDILLTRARGIDL